jgi:hypothetical protein
MVRQGRTPGATRISCLFDLKRRKVTSLEGSKSMIALWVFFTCACKHRHMLMHWREPQEEGDEHEFEFCWSGMSTKVVIRPEYCTARAWSSELRIGRPCPSTIRYPLKPECVPSLGRGKEINSVRATLSYPTLLLVFWLQWAPLQGLLYLRHLARHWWPVGAVENKFVSIFFSFRWRGRLVHTGRGS